MPCYITLHYYIRYCILQYVIVIVDYCLLQYTTVDYCILQYIIVIIQYIILQQTIVYYSILCILIPMILDYCLLQHYIVAWHSIVQHSIALYIPQRGVQWKQGVVIYMTLYASLLYNTTPIHCTPDPLHPPLLSIH